MPRCPRPLLAALLGLTAIRLALAATLPLGDDEAYYWEWSRHLAPGYVDHPPAIAFLVWIAVRILGRTPFAIHVVAVALSFLTSLALWTLAREVTGRDDAAAWTVALYSIVPVFAASSLLVAPDGPLLLCWVMTLLWAWRAARGNATQGWVLVGLWLGLGLQSKYVAAALPVSVGAWLLVTPSARRWLVRPQPYVALLIALVIFAPVVWWNATHRWVSFALTALGTSRWTERANFLPFLSAQFLYVSPLLFPAFLVALAVAAWRGVCGRDARWAFLAGAGWPVLIGAGAGSLLVTAKPHWPAPGYVAAAAALAALATEPVPKRLARARRWAVLLVLAPSAAIAAMLYALPLLTATVLSPRLDPAANYYGWQSAGPAIAETGRRGARGPFFVASDWYQVMAPFDFSTGGKVAATTITGDDQYRFWTALAPFRGWDALFVRDSRQTYDVDLEQVCRSLEPAGSVPLRRGSDVIRRVDLLWCRGFSGGAVPRLNSLRWAPGAGGPALRLTRASF